MDEVVARQEVDAVVVPRGHFTKSLSGSDVHIGTDHQIARAVVLATDIGIARGALDTGMLRVAEDRVAVMEIVIVEPVATQGVSGPSAPPVVHVTIQVTIVAHLQITLLGYCRSHEKLKKRKNEKKASPHILYYFELQNYIFFAIICGICGFFCTFAVKITIFTTNVKEAKIINDPVFGFIKIPRGLLYGIVEHPLFQRLNRINQLGLASVVYPGARHTRFQHSLGAFHLMSEAVLSLQQKGIFIFDAEAEAVQAAILMHDIGHGPFSHVLEDTLIHGISHEDISLLMMEEINNHFNGQLNLAISIFKGEYPKNFLHQLISSQLDMDRLDYLRRDSFYTGVTEGNIGSARIIKMLNVVNDTLVVDQKGIYSLENYLTTRRLMYWQVYLHRTCVAYEKVLVNMLTRAKDLIRMGQNVFASPALHYFLSNNVDTKWFATHPEALAYYGDLDDSDIWSAMKAWKYHEDRILSTLATDMLDRRIFKVEVHEEPIKEERIEEQKETISRNMSIPLEDAHYMMSVDTISKDMYNVDDDSIGILYKNDEIKDISEASELLNVQLLSKKIRKYYLCYQRFE
jgi:hypothetical protein